MFKVFVSYSTHDLQNVDELHRLLAGTEVEVFIANHSVLPGENLSKRISTEIASCDLFVLLWSISAKDSDWVQQEIGKADTLGKQILPLILTEGLNLPGFIKDLKYLPMYDNPTAALEQAKNQVFDAVRAKMAVVEKQEQNETLAILGIGLVLLWALSQK